MRAEAEAAVNDALDEIVFPPRFPPRPLGDWKLGRSDAKRIGRTADIDDPVARYLEVLISPKSLPNPP